MSNNLRLCKLVILSVMILIFSVSLCSAVDFSADLTTRFGKVIVPGRLYVCGNNWRQEFTVEGRQLIFIAHGDTVYTLDPARKQYVQKKSKEKPWSASETLRLVPPSLKKTSLGKTVISGIPCEKIVFTDKHNPNGSITMHISKDLGIAVRTEVKANHDSTIIEFTRIKKGSSPTSLFKLPKDYNKVNKLVPIAHSKSRKP